MEKEDKKQHTLGTTASGTIAFKSFPEEPFRFCVEHDNGRGKIWLENSRSKQQWECAINDIAEFSPKDTTIPREAVLGYIMAGFKSGANNDQFEADLIHKDTKDDLRLEVALKLNMSGFVWTPKYVFPMNQIPIDQIDILTSQLRDQEEELNCLKETLNELKSERETPKELKTQRIELGQLQDRVAALERSCPQLHGY